MNLMNFGTLFKEGIHLVRPLSLPNGVVLSVSRVFHFKEMIEAIALSLSILVLTMSCLASAVSFVHALFEFA